MSATLLLYEELARLRRQVASLAAYVILMRQELQAMSESLHDQVNAAEATIQQEVSNLTAAVAAVGAEVAAQQQQIADLTSQLSPGSQITQDQVDALNAVSSNLQTQVAALQAIAPAPTPTP